MKKVFYILFNVLIVTSAWTQQDPMYTQYMFNGVLYNPAFAGSHEDLSFTLQNRSQWTQIDGAPSTFVMTAHTLLQDHFNGVGAVMFRDQVGATVQTGLKAMFSHKLLLSKKDASITMAVQGGFVSHRTNFQDLLIKDEDDAVFANSTSKLLPNFGVGFLYKAKRYHLTLSAPRIINNKLVSKTTGTLSKESTHVYAGGGVEIPLNDDFKLKPNLLLRFVTGAPLQYDANVNFEMFAKYWVGVSYRVGESVDLLLECKILDNLRVGYSYDFSINSLRSHLGSSHEFMLNYRLLSAKTSKAKPKPYDPKFGY